MNRRAAWLLVGAAGSLAIAAIGLRELAATTSAAPTIITTAAPAAARPAPAPAARVVRTPAPLAAPAPPPAPLADASTTLDRVIAAGAPDVQFEGEVQEALRGELFAGVTTRAVRCVGALCRVELAYPSDELRETVMQQLPHAPPFNSDGLIRQLEDPVRTVVYVARQGQSLPL